MARLLIADDEVQVQKWLRRVLQRRGHSAEQPSWLQMAICCKGDSAPQFWRMQ
jgi:ActR/RegA family two-component response regulator